MAYVTCAISGVLFECSYFSALRLPATEGFPHPIFAANKKFLDALYKQHTKGQLNSTDSYLLFLAYLHSSDKIIWKYSATCNPNEDKVKKLVENNLAQLVAVLNKTNAIRHPRFKQPSFKVTYENANLAQIPNWIKAWEANIEAFYSTQASLTDLDALNKVQNKLANLILSGESPEKYSAVIADWACRAGSFPADKAERYKEVIRTCFNITKMFNTPLALLKEIKAYCEENIEVGSIHFHTLMQVLNEGITRHIDYLGGSSLALGYTILPTLQTVLGADAGSLVPLHSAQAKELETRREQVKEADERLAGIIASAPDKQPVAEDYTSYGEFLKAKLAYRVAANAAKEAAKLKIQLEGL